MSSSAEKTKLEGYDLESCDWIYFYSSRLQTALYLAKVKQRQYVITMMIVLFGVVAVVLLALLPHNSNYIKQSDNQKSLAIIVSGGYDTAYNAKTSVELLHGDGRPWCSLPDLPEISFGHSQTGLEACGGGGPLYYKCARQLGTFAHACGGTSRTDRTLQLGLATRHSSHWGNLQGEQHHGAAG